MAAAFNAASNAMRKAATKADLDRFLGRTGNMPEADCSSVARRVECR
jgi:hypothetical protein